MISSKQCYECFEASLFNIWGLNTERYLEARNICSIMTATLSAKKVRKLEIEYLLSENELGTKAKGTCSALEVDRAIVFPRHEIGKIAELR